MGLLSMSAYLFIYSFIHAMVSLLCSDFKAIHSVASRVVILVHCFLLLYEMRDCINLALITDGLGI